MPRKRAASSFFTLYAMFSPDEKWVLMHIAAAGGEKIAWLPIKAAWKQEKCMDFLLRVLYGIETSFMFCVVFFFLVEKE